MDKIEKVLSDIGLHIQLISYRVVNQLAKEFPDIKLSTNQYFLVYILSQDPDISNQKIAERLSISKSAATQLVQSLINHGLISKCPRSDDLRSNKINFTDKAVLQREVIIKEIASEITKAFGSVFTEKDLETFIKTRQQLRKYNHTSIF